MDLRKCCCSALALLLWNVAACCTSADESLTEPQREFFESRIRPLFVEHCYGCHNTAELAEGDLALDHRAGLLRGGVSGVTIVPGRPDESRLLQVIRHEIDEQKMPAGGPKLDDAAIADVHRWIEMGAPDPRDNPPTAAELKQVTSWETIREKRKQWWSFQPIRNQVPPASPVGPTNLTSHHPIDQFIFDKLRQQGLSPAVEAPRQELLRRLSYALIGLPPTVEELTLFLQDDQPGAYERQVERLLNSQHFGERWARHWMDWIRYAESHGSEGDPAIEGAWRYRDYLVRALNADVPYDQLVREHIAGDLLANPRLNAELGINESLIGTAHWRMVFHGFAPTDALDEKVRFTDDQINVFSKAFLGLTVSCARCHDHKFDPISQKDYYALFGILDSCRPGRTAIDVTERLELHRAELSALKPQIRAAIVADWLASPALLPQRWQADAGLMKAALDPHHVLHSWLQTQLAVDTPEAIAEVWQQQRQRWEQNAQQLRTHEERPYPYRWKFSDPETVSQWYREGTGLEEQSPTHGDFSIRPDGDRVLQGLYPAGVYSHRISAKHAARLTSREIRLDQEYELYLRVLGAGGATVRYVIQSYPRNGTVYPVAELSPNWHWQKFDLGYWTGDTMHVELTTAQDAPLLVKLEPNSWFGIVEAVLVPKGQPGPPAESLAYLEPLFSTSAAPNSHADVSQHFVDILTAALNAWGAERATAAQIELLDRCLQQNVLPQTLEQLTSARPLVERYRVLERSIPVPTRVPTLAETVGRDQPLLTRGNHKTPADEVPRRFLEAIDDRPYETTQSGRLQLAEDVLREDNPLTRRVIVNRLWHHLMGRGLVATPDNFGRMGGTPSHPELLDYLAQRFADEGGSLKKMMRLIVTSHTWRQDSRPSASAREKDPDNLWLSHARLRRLEAEPIRDSLLAVAGELDRSLYGPPQSGNVPRRSIYVAVRRNALDSFLRAFDFPEPFSSTGRRDETNVPAQSLMLMNDEYVERLATAWAERVLASPDDAVEVRIQKMFQQAFSRTATDSELKRINQFLADTEHRQQQHREHSEDLRQRQIALRQSIIKLTAPVRQRLQKEGQQRLAQRTPPEPISRWEFDSDLRDALGALHGTAHGKAHLADGGLVLDGHGSYVMTAPLQQPLKAKTLEAWVQLKGLEQRGGGVMTVQTRSGEQFDAIVFGEQETGHWLPGSNGFVRTQPLRGTVEREAQDTPVHIAITYSADGRIAAFRNGEPYGQTYTSNGPMDFAAEESVISFGVRHLPATGNRMLTGRILRAQLYDRALTADEVRVSCGTAAETPTDEQIASAMEDDQRQRWTDLRTQLSTVDREIESLGAGPRGTPPLAIWRELARALFTMKEFIYIP